MDWIKPHHYQLAIGVLLVVVIIQREIIKALTKDYSKDGKN